MLDHLPVDKLLDKSCDVGLLESSSLVEIYSEGVQQSVIGHFDAEGVVSDVTASPHSLIDQSICGLLERSCAVEVGQAEDGEKGVPEGVTSAGFQGWRSCQSLKKEILVTPLDIDLEN